MARLVALLAFVLVTGLLLVSQATESLAVNNVVVTVADFDGDGCNDIEELGPDQAAGGLRDNNNAWDFYDVAGPDGPPDGLVDMRDVQRVMFRWGSSTGELLYDAFYDRSPLPPAANTVATGPPDGTIAMYDVLAVLSQFGDECRGPFSQTVDLDAECDIVVADGEAGEEIVTEVGESVTQCFLINNPVTGELLDVRKVVAANYGPADMGKGTVAGPAGSPVAVGFYTCTKAHAYESLIFRQDIAKTKVILDFYVIEEPGPYYAFVGYQHARKENDAVSPWSITFWNPIIDVFYTDIYNVFRLAAYTFTGFRHSVTIPIPLFGDITITQDMEIWVQTVGGMDTNGTPTNYSDDVVECWNSSDNT